MSGVLLSPSALATRAGLLPLRPKASLALALALLALSVAALVVLAELLVTQWTDGLLFLAWLLLWVEVFAATAVFDAWRRLHRMDRQPAPGEALPAPRPTTVPPRGAGVSRYGSGAPYL